MNCAKVNECECKKQHPAAPLKSALKCFLFFSASSYAIASFIYFILHSVLLYEAVFGVFYRMFLYHWRYPYQYIAVATLAYSFVATVAVLIWPCAKGWRKFLLISLILCVSVFLASIPGGMLWTLHDMQAGFFPESARFWRDLQNGASMGLALGWLILALSIPYNIFCVIAGYALTNYGFKRYGALFALARATCREDKYLLKPT